MLGIAIGDITAVGWVTVFGKVTVPEPCRLQPVWSTRSLRLTERLVGREGSLHGGSLGKGTHNQCPFIFPEESLAEGFQNRLSCWKAPPGPSIHWSRQLRRCPRSIARPPGTQPLSPRALPQVPGGEPSLAGEKGPPGVVGWKAQGLRNCH